jgi:Tfp pilus assembly protein PilF
MLRLMIALALATGLTACGTEPLQRMQQFFTGIKAQIWLATGLRQYDEGDYTASLRNLQAALNLGLDEADRVRAHKHLGFIHCTSNRERACREEFRKALAVDPALDLAPEEAGHPIWGPVFRSVKAAR